MRKIRLTHVTLGLALLLLTTSTARADIRVTLASGTATMTETSTGNQFLGTFSVGNYSFEIQTAFSTSPMNNGGVGELESTSIVGSTSGSGTLAPLTVTVQDINPDGTLATFGSSSPSSYDVQNAASVTSPVPTTLLLQGSAQINAANQHVAPVGLYLPDAVSGSSSNFQTVNNVTGYTLAQSYTLSQVAGGTTGLTVGFNTSVTPDFSAAAVPEPSSLVLAGVGAVIGAGGFALRRRRKARSL